MKKEGYKIVNVDSTGICEKPRISKYKMKIKDTLSPILKINNKDLSIKATTFEGLGPIGNNEGIACKTIVMLEKIKKK